MSLNQARIVTTIFTALVLFAEVSITEWKVKANPSAPTPTTSSNPTPTNLSKISKNNNIAQINVALEHLKAAKSELENVDDKDLDSRSAALKETNQAIAQIEAALKLESKRSIAKLPKPDICST